jgi:hypothetical protein
MNRTLAAVREAIYRLLVHGVPSADTSANADGAIGARVWALLSDGFSAYDTRVRTALWYLCCRCACGRNVRVRVRARVWTCACARARWCGGVLVCAC